MCRLILKYGQSDIVQILLLNYGQEKHKSDIVQILRNKGRVTAEFSKWTSVWLILIETTDSRGMVAVDRGVQLEKMREAQVMTDVLCPRL